MTASIRVVVSTLLFCLCIQGIRAQSIDASERGFLKWTRANAETIGRSMRSEGRVGGALDLRVVHTEHSYNYKLRATWLTPEVIRATARLAQLADGLTDVETVSLVREAESPAGTVVLVEIDPREGSGVIPLDWIALMRPKNATQEIAGVRGTNTPALGKMRALAGVFRRDYSYEQFWLVFPSNGTPPPDYLSSDGVEAELVVRIRNKEGRVSWRVPESIKRVVQR